MLLNHGLAVVEVDLDFAGVEDVVIHRNGGIDKGEGGYAQAESKDDDGHDAARQLFSSFHFSHGSSPPCVWRLQAK